MLPVLLLALVAGVGDAPVHLEWSASPSCGVVAYQVERFDGAAWREVARVAALTWSGPAGRYRVRSISSTGNVSAEARELEPNRCLWRGAPVGCERACACAGVLARLELARRALVEASLVDSAVLDSAIARVSIDLVSADRLRTREGQAAGAASPRSLLLATDMRAASHELYHLYQAAIGVPEAEQRAHLAWSRIARLREIDTRAGLARIP